ESYAPNVRPSVAPAGAQAAATAERVIASAHIVKLSDEDLDFLFPGVAPRQLAARLLGPGRATALLVVTKGGEGATVATAAGQFSVPAVPLTVVGTVGAGDAFLAALLAGPAHLRRLSPEARAGRLDAGEQALREIAGRAVAAAALTCTRPGADPPTAGELSRFRAEVGDAGAAGRGGR